MSINFGQFTRKGGWWVVAQFVLFAVIIASLTQNQSTEPLLEVIGWALVAMALLLAGTAMWLIRRKITALPAPLEGAVLMDRGPFALVRHPIYGGVILGFLGLAIKGGNPLAVLVSLLLIPFFLAKTRHEEQLLVEQIPDYAEYRLRVRRRFLPWIL